MEDFPNDENGRVLRDMAASGDDLSQPRDIDFSILFHNEQAARSFCKLASTEGLTAGLEEPGTTSGEWDVTVTSMMLPSHGAITAMEERLAQLASSFDGRMDGWGCFAVPTR